MLQHVIWEVEKEGHVSISRQSPAQKKEKKGKKIH
jgi:hypothetical protein